MKRLDIPVGTRFWNLTVVKEVEANEKKRRQFLCRCDCGNERVFSLARLRTGKLKTCGCRSTVNRQLNVNDYIGKRYGKLVVIGEAEQEKGKRFRVKCRCDCGTVKDYPLLNLNNNQMPTRSCGCSRGVRDGIKNRSKERLYKIYENIKARCFNSNTPNFYNYGGRGITMCKEWVNSYAEFRKWALENGYKNDLTIDRINNNGNYEPNNCRWVSMKVQSNNKRTNVRMTYNGETHTLTEWSEIVGLSMDVVRFRYHKGLSAEEVLAKK